MTKNEKELFKVGSNGGEIIFYSPIQKEIRFKSFKTYDSIYNMACELLKLSGVYTLAK